MTAAVLFSSLEEDILSKSGQHPLAIQPLFLCCPIFALLFLSTASSESTVHRDSFPARVFSPFIKPICTYSLSLCPLYSCSLAHLGACISHCPPCYSILSNWPLAIYSMHADRMEPLILFLTIFLKVLLRYFRSKPSLLLSTCAPKYLQAMLQLSEQYCQF